MAPFSRPSGGGRLARAMTAPRTGAILFLLLTFAAPAIACTGDCDGDGQVGVA